MSSPVQRIQDYIKEWTISANLDKVDTDSLYEYIKNLVDKNDSGISTQLNTDLTVSLIKSFEEKTDYRIDIKTFDMDQTKTLTDKLDELNLTYDNIDPLKPSLIDINNLSNRIGIWFDSKINKKIDTTYRIVINTGHVGIPFLLDVYILEK